MGANLTVLKKGLILVAVPLLFQLVFIGVLVWVQRAEGDADAWVAHTKEVLIQTQTVQQELLNAETGMRGFIITGDPAFAKAYDHAAREVAKELEHLEWLVSDNPGQQSKARAIAAKAGRFLAWHTQNRRLVDRGATGQAAARVGTATGARQMDDLRAELGAFLQEEKRLDAVRGLWLQRLRSRFSWLLAIGTALSFSCALCLALVFTRGISGRLATLTANARRLAQGQALAPAIRGSDEIARLDGVFRDMAKELRRSEEALLEQTRILQSVLDSMGDGVVVADEQGTFLLFNPAAEQILGVGATDAHPDEWTQRYGVYLPDQITPYPAAELPLARAIRGEAVDAVEQFIRNAKVPDGVWLSVTGRPLKDKDGRARGGVVVFGNCTARKRAEQEIRKLNEGLEQRVVERTAELAEANRELVQKNRENEMFVYSVSHDLRSPLVNLQGFSKELGQAGQDFRALLADAGLPEAVRRRGIGLVDGEMAESIRFIQTAVERLSGIIDALLRLSRAGRVEFRHQHVPMNGLLARVVEAMSSTMAERGAAVTVADLPPAWGDPTAVEQVFANLVGNALNYLDPSRPGVIEIGSANAAGTAAPGGRASLQTYYVRDNGLGIPEPYAPKVFQAFQRLHPGRAKGEGIGLAMVRRTVERHGGRIWFESTEGAGSTFFVALPAPSGNAGPEACEPNGTPLNQGSDSHANGTVGHPAGRR
ncbi:MAG TPA: CHASE3 domain-containing protein [Gemmataceae bacterium]|nr:CHASE3 domain-containing protein [Gemmataceae bacterium]